MTFKEACELCRTNTGVAMCDSGSIYGYGYNKEIPKSLIDEENLLISTPHWLYLNCEITEECKRLQERFIQFTKESEDKGENKYWPELMEDFLLSLNINFCNLQNSYNYESDLDQVIQYIYFTIDDIQYLFLQVHTGCDVRGGYTSPLIVELLGEPSENFTGYCTACEKSFESVYQIEESCEFGNWWTQEKEWKHVESLRWKGEPCNGRVRLTISIPCDKLDEFDGLLENKISNQIKINFQEKQ